MRFGPPTLREVFVKEEKRILLAFLLISLIVLVFYSRHVPQAPSPPETSSQKESFRKGLREEEGPSLPSSPETLFTLGEESEVHVETDLYHAVLSTKGGTLKSIEMKHYRGWEWDPLKRVWKERERVELIPEGRRALSLSLGKESPSLESSRKGVDLSEASFHVDLKGLNLYQAGEEGKIRFSLVLPSGEEIKKTYHFREGSYLIGLEWEGGGAEKGILTWGAGLRATEKKESDLQDFSAVVLMGGEYLRYPRKESKKEVVEPIELDSKSGQVSWAGVRNKYFLASMIPREGEVEGFTVQQTGLKEISISLTTHSSSVVLYDIYLGPIDYDELEKLGVGLEKVVDLGWEWVRPISRGILYLMKFLHRVLPGHNYGVVIILFSGLMMIVFFPLYLRSLRATQEMQRLQPKINQIRERLKKEPQEMNREIMSLYKKHKVNPLGGCLPLLFQMPVFFGLYAILRSTIELRGASFLTISDLSQPYPVLALIMGGTMFLQQRFTGVSSDPRQKMMMWMMPVFMTVIFINFPAGLVLYWLVYNILSLIQHFLIRKREKGEEVTA